ncbi:MAG: hypothetical protein RH862_12160 [Leptospiraceae bacterium]
MARRQGFSAVANYLTAGSFPFLSDALEFAGMIDEQRSQGQEILIGRYNGEWVSGEVVQPIEKAYEDFMDIRRRRIQDSELSPWQRNVQLI